MPSKKQNGGVIAPGYGGPGLTGNGYAGVSDIRRPQEFNGSTGSHVYAVDHLVTWSVGSEHGVLTHEDGMRQLSKMEQQTGIFTMRCTLSIEDNTVSIVDGQSGDRMEEFPLNCIRDPVAVRDKNGMFNNITLFTVVEDPKNKHSPSEMHIFQVISRSAKELADDVADAKQAAQSKTNRSSKNHSQPQASPSQQQRAESYGNETGAQPISVQDAINKFEHTTISHPAEHTDVVVSSSRQRQREQIKVKKNADSAETDSEDDVMRGVALMNRCFDDVERFVLRLKQSAKALQELTSRKKHSKHKRFGDGMLTMRSRAPSPAEFVECFQKFKLSFNILARLRSYLHNPNSAELVHFLFTPLSLLVEASNDPRFDIHDLVGKVVTPLLTKNAVELLQNCLTSREHDFWMSLGEAWSTPRNRWHGDVQEYRPKFSDGWQPSDQWLDMFLYANSVGNLVAKQAQNRMSREVEEEPAQHFNGLSINQPSDYRQARRTSNDARSPVSPTSPNYASPLRPTELPGLYTDRSSRTLDSGEAANRKTPWDEYQKNYLRDLQQKSAKIYEVVQDRKGNNSQELTIRKGEILEVIDDARNWWKCSNINGDRGFVPYTLLKKYENLEEVQTQTPSEPSISQSNERIVDVLVDLGARLKVEESSSPPISPDYNGRTSAVSPGQTTSAAPHHVPAPPPPPPTMPPPPMNGNNNWRMQQKNTSTSSKVEVRNKPPKKEASRQQSEDFSSELAQRLSRINLSESQQGGGGRRLSSTLTAKVFIDSSSSADEVADWLDKKGFQEQTKRVLAGYNGSELFHLSNDAFIGEFGQQEGSRLISQIKLMKTSAGYTQSGSSQLRKILERRKQRAENDYDNGSPNSDVVFDLEDSDDFASASMVRGDSRNGNMDRRY